MPLNTFGNTVDTPEQIYEKLKKDDPNHITRKEMDKHVAKFLAGGGKVEDVNQGMGTGISRHEAKAFIAKHKQTLLDKIDNSYRYNS